MKFIEIYCSEIGCMIPTMLYHWKEIIPICVLIIICCISFKFGNRGREE